MPGLNHTNGTDYSVIALYFVVVVCVGFYSARKSRTTKEYFRGDGRIPWPLAGFSAWASGFTAFMFVGAAGFVYRSGLSALLLFLVPCAGTYLLSAFTLAKMWRRVQIGTPMEFLTRRYSPSTTYFYSVASIVPTAVNIGLGLYIVCLFISSVLGIADRPFALAGLRVSGFQASVVVVGLVMVVYTAIGGLWAAILTSTVQTIILAVMSVVMFLMAFRHLGGGDLATGLHRLLREAPPDAFRPHGETANPFFLLAFLVSEFLCYSATWPLIQRYRSVADERGARKMAFLCSALASVAPLLWFLPVMAARVIFPDIRALWPGLAVPEEASYVSLALLLLPHGMLGFVVSAVLSAALGGANTNFNWLTATVAHDVYVPLHRRLGGGEPTDRQQMRVAHATMVGLGIFAVATALYIPRFGGAFRFMLDYFSLAMTFYVPVILGLVWRRTPWWSGIAACASGLAAAALLMALGAWPDHAFARNILTQTGVAAAVFAVSARWYRDDDPRSAGARLIAAEIITPAISDRPASSSGELRVYGMIGIVTGALGATLLVCAFLPPGAGTSSTVDLAAGLFLAALGAWLWRFRA